MSQGTQDNPISISDEEIQRHLDDAFGDISEIHSSSEDDAGHPNEDNDSDIEILGFRSADNPSRTRVASATVWDLQLSRGQVVELSSNNRDDIERSGDFLRVHHILQDPASKEVVALSGLLLRRNLFSRIGKPAKNNHSPRQAHFLDCKLNELHIVTQCIQGQDDWVEDGLVEVDIAEIIPAIRRKVLFSNQHMSIGESRVHDGSFRDTVPIRQDHTKEDKAMMWNNGRLVCRWVYLSILSPAGAHRKTRDIEGQVLHLNEQHLRSLSAVSNRGVNIYSDLARFENSTIKVPPAGASVNFGDLFCGVGGASEGARISGSFDRIIYAVDSKDKALSAYANNSDPGTMLVNLGVTDFCDFVAGYDYAHVVHMSPPCQDFCGRSFMHPTNEANQDAMYVVHYFLKIVKPTLVTLENTDGLVRGYPTWFNSLVNQFTSLNYSVIWKCLDFSGFGVPQRRKRLVLFASAPGLNPPKFPAPTHGPGTGRALVTIGAALAQIPSNASHHGHRYYRTLRCPKPPYDENTLARTVMTNGGNNYHPSGLRTFSVRDFATLQGFRHDFIFPERLTEARKVIGNAVPPSAMAVLYRGFRAHLEREFARLRASGPGED